jgi:hypothetical protein
MLIGADRGDNGNGRRYVDNMSYAIERHHHRLDPLAHQADGLPVQPAMTPA